MHQDLEKVSARLVGIELYFDDLRRATTFYNQTLGLEISEQDESRYAKFDFDGAFVCLERKGVESYPSRDKAVLFFEVPDLQAAIRTIGEERFVQKEERWAVLHDPEGHNVLLMQR